MTESWKVADDALRRLTEKSKRVRLLEKEAIVLNSLLGKIEKECGAAVSGFGGRLREVMTLEVRVRKLQEELDFIERRDSANCSPKEFFCIVAGALSDNTKVFTKLPCDTVSLDSPTRLNVNEILVEISKRFKNAFECKACSLQQGFLYAVRAVSECTQGSFAGAPGAAGKYLEVIIGCATRT